MPVTSLKPVSGGLFPRARITNAIFPSPVLSLMLVRAILGLDKPVNRA